MSLLQLAKPIIYDKEVSGFKTKVELWCEETNTLRVTVYDHTCHIRFMHTFVAGSGIEDVFEDIMARVKHAQIDYATEEWALIRANREIGYRGN